jgi:hypothetical protein
MRHELGFGRATTAARSPIPEGSKGYGWRYVPNAYFPGWRNLKDLLTKFGFPAEQVAGKPGTDQLEHNRAS